MEQKIIEIPNGYKVNWEKSKKQNKIIIEEITNAYNDICNKLFKSGWYYIGNDGDIKVNNGNPTCRACSNNSLSEHQLQVLLAKNRLANVAKYVNNGWKPSGNEVVDFISIRKEDKTESIIINTDRINNIYDCIVFKTYSAAENAINILGEKQIKLALSNLY